MLDILNNDVFSVSTMTERVNKMPHVPGRVGALGIFTARGVRTTSVQFDAVDGVVRLIPTNRRGAPATQFAPGARKTYQIEIPQLTLEDTVNAHELLNMRAAGTEQMIASAQEVVDERLADMVKSHDATVEFQRQRALNGVVVDADGSTVILDMFQLTGTSQIVTDCDLEISTTDVREKVVATKREILRELGADAASVTGWLMLMSPTYTDAFTANDSVLKAFDRMGEGVFLRSDVREGFDFAGVRCIEADDYVGAQRFIEDGAALLLPVGPSIYREYYGPGDFIDTVGSEGLPRYARTEPVNMGRGLKVHTQSNPICFPTKPGAIAKLTA
jgi:phage baseplate assembly protein gpV